MYGFGSHQEHTLGFFHADLVLDERSTQKPAVLYGDTYHLTEQHKVHPDRIVTAMILHAEVQLEIVDEHGGYLFQRNVAHVISRFEKPFQVIVNGQVFLLRRFCLHFDLYQLVKIAVELLVNFQQRFVAVFQT